MKYIRIMILCLPLTAAAQDTVKVRRFDGLVLAIAPQYSYRMLRYTAASRWQETLRNDEIPNLGFKVSARIRYRINQRFNMLAGVQYANNSVKTRYKDLTWSSDNPALPAQSRILYQYKFLAVPIQLNYYYTAVARLRWFAAVGMTTNIFLSRKTRVETRHGQESKNASPKSVGYTTFTWSATLSAGAEYTLGKRFLLRAEPFFEQYITSIVTDNTAREYPFSFGLSTGVLWLF